MGLPGGDRAEIDSRKITDYLPSPVHPVGRHKARLFRALGFSRSDADRLTRALLDIALDGSVTSHAVTPHGRRYIVEGVVDTPAGTRATIRTVWIISEGSDRPQFVTAFPRRAVGRE